MKWPEQVPVLKPEDFVLGPKKKGCRRCLLAWKYELVGFQYGAICPMFDAVEEEDGGDICSYEAKDTASNRRLAARIWSNFLKRLGYTEDGPMVDL